MADRTENGADRTDRNSLDLDALAVSDRFRLFNFTRRDDHVAYLWVLRALDRACPASRIGRGGAGAAVRLR